MAITIEFVACEIGGSLSLGIWFCIFLQIQVLFGRRRRPKRNSDAFDSSDPDEDHVWQVNMFWLVCLKFQGPTCWCVLDNSAMALFSFIKLLCYYMYEWTDWRGGRRNAWQRERLRFDSQVLMLFFLINFFQIQYGQDTHARHTLYHHHHQTNHSPDPTLQVTGDHGGHPSKPPTGSNAALGLHKLWALEFQYAPSNWVSHPSDPFSISLCFFYLVYLFLFILFF